jgi:hypothetical protein
MIHEQNGEGQNFNLAHACFALKSLNESERSKKFEPTANFEDL